ncbi:MAG TPA: putative Ig domain-containing protein, partial [Blastocatellia bacterium]
MAISSFHQVLGNYVGVDVTGTVALGNSGYGIVAGNNCTIGGTSAGARNIVAASGADGIAFLSLGMGASSQVLGNYIGTDVTGTVDLGNNRYGVYIRESGDIVVGGTTPAERNIISGNTTVGVFLHAANDCQVLGNYIGPNVNGTAAFSSQYGVQVDAGTGGGMNHLISGNVIGGHSIFGVLLSNPINNRLFGNIIGASPTLAPMPNHIGVATGGNSPLTNQIGGTGPGEGNIIAFNTYGVSVGSGVSHKISGNSIYSNSTLGIDLSPDGVTPNDLDDGDTGANNLQNFPILTQVTTNGISGTLNSEANKMYTIQFFHNPACDTLGNGEGKTYIDQIAVTTNGSGNALINYVGAVPSGGVVTATATENTSGNTSEFSSCQTVVDCPPTITLSPTTMPNGFTGTAYNQTITANPAGNYNYTLTGGNLPDGLQLVQVNASTGAVTGTPTVPGMYTFTITATTNGVCTGSQTYTVYINCPGATITVTTTLDGVTPDDKCSLREAIMAANGVTTANGCSPGVSGLDTIYFAIGSGTPFIPVLTTPLPTITSPVVIDGSQCQSTRVELSGALAGANANGLHITAGGSTVRAMVINRFSAHGIHLENNGTNKVENCLIGTDAGGTLDRGNGGDGIQILNSPNNLIGGTAAGQRNIISGNDQIGVEVLDPGASGNIIRGNFIGTDITGSQALSNVRDGVLINNASNNTVGGQATGAGNLISANGIPAGTKGAGVAIANPNAGANQVVRNLIGTTLSGGPLGNYDGVRILQGTRVNFISENTIANSERHGIWVGDVGTDLNSILSNSIHSNGLLGIDLGGDGVTPNDALDADSGPNIRQNYPVLDQVLTTAITFTLDSEPATKYHVQFFGNTACDSSGYGEGRTLIGGITTLPTDSNGHLTDTFIPTTALASGTIVTATATKLNSSGGFVDTSEFSACKVACADITFTPQTLPNGEAGTIYNQTITANPADSYTYAVTAGALPTGLNFGSDGSLTGTPTTPGSYTFTVTATTSGGCTGSMTYTIFINCPGATITVTTAADENGTNPGGCSLREAIQAANLDSPVGGCPAGVAGLDTIYFYIGTGTPTINILGSQLPTILQPVIIDGSQCQSTRVELNGAGAGSNARGFLITAGNSTIRSMVINRFTESAISIATGGGNVIENCYLGTNSTGTAALGNGRDGVRIASSPNNRIGSLNSTVRNLISGNNEYGILISFAGATGNQVLGNYIGLHVNGTQAIGNGLGGVRINDAQNNLIGGTSGGARNYISGNVLDGVFLLGPNATGNVVQNNLIGIAAVGAAPLGNGRDGVQIDGARDNLIGGATTIAGNDIANNARAGVLVTDSAGAGTGNSILTNSIYNNQGLGIDLAPGVETNTGVTANDGQDGDTGPNELQNFPMLTLATHALVTGTLNSKPNTSYLIQVFVHAGCDASGNGEGSVFLG